MAVQQLVDLDFVTTSTATNLKAPVNPGDAVRLQDLQSAIEGLNNKDEVLVSTQGNINLAAPGASIDGRAMASGERFLARSQTATAENGIYIWSGAATPATRAPDANTGAELRQAIVTVAFGTDAGATFRQTATVTTIGTDAVTWVAFGNSAPAASTTVAGIVELATQSEVDAGTPTGLAVTVGTLTAWAGRKQKATLVIGDGTATQFDITHNFNTQDVIVQVVRNSAPFDTVFTDQERPTVNTARVRFSAAPAANAFKIIAIA